MALLQSNLQDVARWFHRAVITKDKVVDVARQLRNFSVTEEFENKELRSKDSKDFRHELVVGSYNNIQYDSFFNPDSLTRSPLGQEGTSYWSMVKTGYAVDRREPGWPTKTSAEQIVDVFKLHRKNMIERFYEDAELQKWSLAAAPNDGSGAYVVPNGVPYFLVQSTTRAVGYNGGHPSGYSSVSGLSRTTYPQLKNMTGTYAAVSHTDFAAQLSKMIDLLRWEMPTPDAIEVQGSSNYIIESTYDPFAEYQTLATSSNTDIGPDMGKYRGKVPMGAQYFRGVPWVWRSALNESTLRDGSANPAYAGAGVDPIYVRDKSTWKLYGAQGLWMDESEPSWQDNPHNAVSFHMDHVYQRVCIAPQLNGVLRRYTS